MNRRTFLWKTVQLACALQLAPLGFAARENDIPSSIETLYRKSLVIDALAGVDADNLPLKPQTLQQALESGVTACNWTVSQPDFEGTVENIAFTEGLVENDSTHWLIVRRYSDLERAKREQKIGIILGFQHPEPMGEDLRRFETFRRLGVRVIQLTYNNRGLFGDGCLEPGNAGLSKLGLAAVAKMNELGIAVDLSHCGQRTTAEGIEASTKPVLITHAGCSAIHPHPRNKDDRELQALADRGGVIGIYFMPYLVASPTFPAREHVLAHLDHALKVCGSDHVGIGTDGVLGAFPDTPAQRQAFAEDMARRKKLGIAAPEEDRPPFSPDLNTPHRLEIIAAGLSQRGYASEVIEKVLGKNFCRAFGEIWGSA
ncbi:MAG TPA: membrane dipeptidase [Terriglobales bacterium]|jgi:membrane dipeptidase|nr:membrane dipeptidase [Terriglobales bacterium]